MINDKNLKDSKMQERNKLLFVRQKNSNKEQRTTLTFNWHTTFRLEKQNISAVNLNEAFSISDFSFQWINLMIFYFTKSLIEMKLDR